MQIENLLPSNPAIMVMDVNIPIKNINARRFFKYMLSDDEVPGFVNRFAKLKN